MTDEKKESWAKRNYYIGVWISAISWIVFWIILMVG